MWFKKKVKSLEEKAQDEELRRFNRQKVVESLFENLEPDIDFLYRKLCLSKTGVVYQFLRVEIDNSQRIAFVTTDANLKSSDLINSKYITQVENESDKVKELRDEYVADRLRFTNLKRDLAVFKMKINYNDGHEIDNQD